jgi:hypothetical protein
MYPSISTMVCWTFFYSGVANEFTLLKGFGEASPNNNLLGSQLVMLLYNAAGNLSERFYPEKRFVTYQHILFTYHLIGDC